VQSSNGRFVKCRVKYEKEAIRMATSMPPVPAIFKPIQHHIKTAAEHDSREPVVAYYCNYIAYFVMIKLVMHGFLRYTVFDMAMSAHMNGPCEQDIDIVFLTYFNGLWFRNRDARLQRPAASASYILPIGSGQRILYRLGSGLWLVPVLVL